MQRTKFRERTMFVTIEDDGLMHWADVHGRFGHAGGFGGFHFTDGEEQHFRGDKKLTPEEAERERQEFTVEVQLTTTEFEPIKSFINSVGKPWLTGWDAANSKKLHELLAMIYWKRVNQFVHDPFDEKDA